MGRLVGLDVGTKTIGVAMTDPERRVVLPSRTLSRKGVRLDVEALRKLFEELRPEAVIVGLPYELDDTEARSARLARQIGEAVAAATALPVHYVDERYTSVEAHALLIEADVSRARRKQVVDQVAAMRILERFLAENR